MKLEPKSQRSRLMQICDSSSDEEDASNGRDSEDVKMDAEEEVVVKKEKENKTPSPDKTANNKTNGSSSGKRRIKVKRSVTKTYEDDEGFISKSKNKQIESGWNLPNLFVFESLQTPFTKSKKSVVPKKKK